MAQLVCPVALFFQATLLNSKKGGRVARDLLFILSISCLSHLVSVTPGCCTVPHWHLCRGLISTTLMDGLSRKGSLIQPSGVLNRTKWKTLDIFYVFLQSNETFLTWFWARMTKQNHFFIYISCFWGRGAFSWKLPCFRHGGNCLPTVSPFFIGTNIHIVKMWASCCFFSPFFFC